MDRLTLTYHEPRHAAAGHRWFARLLAPAPAKWFGRWRRCTPAPPRLRSRGAILRYFDRSRNTLAGSSGCVNPEQRFSGPSETPTAPTSDEFEERRLRALLAYEEWLADCVSHFKVTSSPDLGAAQQALEDARADTKASQARRPQPATQLPGFTAFAELAETTAERLYGTTGQVPSKMPYKRAAESSHAGLYGLHGDKAINAEGLYVFEQSDADLCCRASWRLGG